MRVDAFLLLLLSKPRRHETRQRKPKLASVVAQTARNTGQTARHRLSMQQQTAMSPILLGLESQAIFQQ